MPATLPKEATGSCFDGNAHDCNCSLLCFHHEPCEEAAAAHIAVCPSKRAATSVVCDQYGFFFGGSIVVHIAATESQERLARGEAAGYDQEATEARTG